MARYRKKPVEIEAVQYSGRNYPEIAAFAPFSTRFNPDFGGLEIYAKLEDTWVQCPKGHYVIKGLLGEFYPCDPEVFNATYEKV